MTRPTTVLLVDDHQMVRAGLATLLEASDDITVAGQAADGEQAVTAAAELDPDVILMDLSMPVVDGVTATGQVCAELPDTRINVSLS